LRRGPAGLPIAGQRLIPLRFTPDTFSNPHAQLRLVIDRFRRAIFFAAATWSGTSRIEIGDFAAAWRSRTRIIFMVGLKVWQSRKLKAKLSTHRHSGALQSVQRDARIPGIEEAIKSPAACLHARCHGSFCEAILFHCGLDLIGEDLLNSLLLTFAKYPLFGQESIEGRSDVSSFIVSHFNQFPLCV